MSVFPSMPIRVLHEVAGLGNGGVETFLMNVYRNIDRTKIQFDFILSHDWGIHLYDKEINEMGGHIYYLPEGGSQFLAFYQFLKTHKEYRIVHSHRGAFGSFYLFVAWLSGVKHRIAHSHTAGAERKSKAFFVVLMRPFLRIVSTHRFSCGRNAGEWMFGKAQFDVINNSIDISSFRHFEHREEVRHHLGINTNDFVIGHVGRFTKEKNHAFLLDVFNVIHKTRNNSKLLLIGDGPLKPNIQEKAQRLGIYQNIIFLQNRHDVNLLLTAMDFVVFPSLFEGFSIAMLEMQASALRIMASDSIPKEINVCGSVFFKSLTESKEDWAAEVLSLSDYDRENLPIDKLYTAGYDIASNARDLEAFYLSL